MAVGAGAVYDGSLPCYFRRIGFSHVNVGAEIYHVIVGGCFS